MPRLAGSTSTTISYAGAHLGLIWLLRRLTRHYGKAVRRALDDAGHTRLPQQGFWAVHALGEDDHTAGQLVERMGISKQAVSQLVETLVGLGYVERRSDPGDRRRVSLALTDSGRVVAQVIEGAIEGLQAELAERIGPEELDHLRGTLTNLVSET